MTRVPSLSKSHYISGDQCHLKLWYDTYPRGLASEPDDTPKAVFATRYEAGKMASRRYGGDMVAHDYRVCLNRCKHRLLHNGGRIAASKSVTNERLALDDQPERGGWNPQNRANCSMPSWCRQSFQRSPSSNRRERSVPEVIIIREKGE